MPTFLSRHLSRTCDVRRGCVLAAVAAAALAAVSCDSQTSVDSTIPEHNDEAVSPRSIVAVELSNGFSDKDMLAALDPRNFVVTGDLTSGAYTGTLQLNRRKRLRRGMTVEDLTAELAARPDPDGDTAAPADTDDGENGEDGDKGKTIKTGRKNRKNTLVFLLAPGTSFKAGETIRVSVASRVSANGTQLRRHKTFSFRVQGNSGAQGELRVTDTSPGLNDTLVSSRPRVTAEFNRAVKKDGVAAAMTLRGEQSGAHGGGDTSFPQTSGSDGVLEVARRLAQDDAFLPGEIVHVSWSSAITDVASAGATAAKLEPHLLSFQVRSGEVVGGWTPALPPLLPAPAVALVVADFLPDVPGVEILGATASQLTLYRHQNDGVWTGETTDVPDETLGELSVRGLEAYDTDDNGIPEVVIFLSGPGGSRVVAFKVDAAGDLTASGKSLDLPVADAAYLGLQDFDANGKPELMLAHESVSVPVPSGSRAQRSGRFSLVTIELVPPDPDDINPLDPQTALPQPGFVPKYNPIDGVSLARRAQTADFNRDGKLDLVLETEDGLVLHRNIAAASQPFALRQTRVLAGRNGAAPGLRAWTPADVDGDGDVDLLVWDDQGALWYENRLAGAEEDEADLAGSFGLAGILSDSLGPQPFQGLPALSEGARARALDLDGRDGPDLALLEPSGRLLLLLSRGDGDATFEVVEQAAPPGAVSWAFADVDGNSGLDAVVAGGTQPRVFLAQDVEPPPVILPSRFAFAPDQAGGLTDLSGETMRLTVLGDLTERYGGFTVALDYDERLLDYQGFEEPIGFRGIGSFTVCPTPRSGGGFDGCTGNAAAVLTLSKDTRVPPAAGTILGTFLFKRKTVSQSITTTVELETFTGPNNARFENKLAVVDGSTTVDIPADIADGRITVTLAPPPPPDLSIECAVLRRAASTLSGRVTWSSPTAAPFESFDVSIAGVVAATLPGTAASYDFETELAGRIAVAVTGRGEQSLAVTSQCEVLGIHAPVVTCVAESAGNPPVRQNRVTWTLDHISTQPVDRFVVLRNGQTVNTTGDGITTEFVDNAPSAGGGDNYDVAALIGVVRGPIGSCQGGPVGDPRPQETRPPKDLRLTLLGRTRSADPNRLSCVWTNDEGYGSMAFRLERIGDSTPIVNETLPGGQTSFTAEGDLGRGGLKPGKYIFHLTATANGVQSETVSSPQATIIVPTLDVSLTCVPDAASNVEVAWQEVWRGYTAFKLIVEHRIDNVLQGNPLEIPLDLAATRFLVSDLAPVGAYTFVLEAGYTDPLPPDLAPLPGSLRRSCLRSFAASLTVGTIEAGVGMEVVEIPVYAQILGDVNGFHFELEYPDFFEPRAVAPVRINAPNVTPETLSFEAGTQGATRKVVITVSGIAIPVDGDGDGLADPKVLLATLVGSIPGNFSLAGTYPLTFRGISTLRFGEAGSQVVPADPAARLVVRRRYLMLDSAEIAAGSVEPQKLAVRATFNAAGPRFHMNSLQLRILWDPSEVELLPVTLADQQETVFFDTSTRKLEGTFLPLPIDGELLRSTNAAGDLKASWLGFDLLNVASAEPVFLEPGIAQKIFVLRFVSRLPAGTAKRAATIRFLSERRPGDEFKDELITALFPEESIPNEPTIEGFFSGGLKIAASASAFSVRSVSPNRGPLTGGAEAVVTGTGFLPGGARPSDLALRLLRPSGAAAPVGLNAEILDVEDTAIRFRVPDSGLRTLSPASTLADLQVGFGAASRTLLRAYSYEAPRILAADRTAVAAGGGELVVLTGAGFAPLSTAALRVAGVAAPFAVAVSDVAADGSRLLFTTPDLRGQEGKRATIEVTVPRLPTVTFSSQIEIRPGTGGTELVLNSADPDRATICGGETVTLQGDGFLAGLTVRFGDVPAQSVELIDGRTARAVTPAFSEAIVATGAASVPITVAVPGGGSVRRDSFFTIDARGPLFRRGDVNQNNVVEIADATLLSDLIAGKATAFPANNDAMDANDDGAINGGDVTAILRNLFAGEGDLPRPFVNPGLDPTPDSITSCGS